MSHEATGWAQTQTTYKGLAKFVLQTCAGYADRFTGEFFYRQKTIAEDCGVSLATVKRVIKRLREDGLLTSSRQFADTGSEIHCHYRLNLEKLEALAAKARMEKRAKKLKGNGSGSAGGVAQLELGGSSDSARGVAHSEPSGSSEGATQVAQSELGGSSVGATKESVLKNQSDNRSHNREKKSREHAAKSSVDRQYAEEFEYIQSIYPSREGSQPWSDGFKSYRARRKEGHSFEALMTATSRYKAYSEFKGNIDTSYVMQAKRFFGKSLEFQNPWRINYAAQRQGYSVSGALADCDALQHSINASSNGEQVPHHNGRQFESDLENDDFIEGECFHEAVRRPQ